MREDIQLNRGLLDIIYSGHEPEAAAYFKEATKDAIKILDYSYTMQSFVEVAYSCAYSSLYYLVRRLHQSPENIPVDTCYEVALHSIEGAGIDRLAKQIADETHENPTNEAIHDVKTAMQSLAYIQVFRAITDFKGTIPLLLTVYPNKLVINRIV